MVQRDLLLELLLAIDLASDTVAAAHPTRLPGTAVARGQHSASGRLGLHRAAWMQQVDRVIVLRRTSQRAGSTTSSPTAWETAVQRSQKSNSAAAALPVAAIPTAQRAQQMGVSPAELEALLLPALLVPAADLQARIAHILRAATGAQQLVIRSGTEHELHMQHGSRPWLSDDGHIDADDRARGAIVSNLPAGSIYTTVLEAATEGSIWLPRAGKAEDVVLVFENGRITDIHAAKGADSLTALFDRHSGEPRRISHIGIGLNPHLHQPIGWTLVDEHVDGYLFLASVAPLHGWRKRIIFECGIAAPGNLTGRWSRFGCQRTGDGHRLTQSWRRAFVSTTPSGWRDRGRVQRNLLFSERASYPTEQATQ
ncbi:MAG: aminopeptidase [Chloroflexota bacterium]